MAAQYSFFQLDLTSISVYKRGVIKISLGSVVIQQLLKFVFAQKTNTVYSVSARLSVGTTLNLHTKRGREEMGAQP